MYPFCLLSLKSEAIGLAEGDVLAVRLGHKARPDDDAQLLTKGTVYLRKRATINADFIGMTTATYNEDTAIGTIVPAPLASLEEEEEIAGGVPAEETIKE